MNEPNDLDLTHLDRTAEAASRALHDHVARRVDPEVLLAALPPAEPPRSRGRFVAAAAAVALILGSVAVLGDGTGGDGTAEVDVDALPTPQPGVLVPLDPDDGRDSIQLPVTVEPSTGLDDGDTVVVRATGFVPGERVGIVQCASEAGGETREQRAGIDGCNVSSVEYADADDEGVATGTFTVRRVVTTPITGTVDCATEAERCVIGIGALNDYDRSGGLAISFEGGGEPIDIPTIQVSPAEGLGDGDTVRVEGSGFAPHDILSLSVCAVDPAGCWHTGVAMEISEEELEEIGREGQYGGPYFHTGLQADEDGRVAGDVPVWRFLPGDAPGTYIDCAVSRCALRVSSEVGHAPAPAALSFAPGGPGPRPPAIAAQPTRDLSPGDTIGVRGAGFAPGAWYSISLCVAPAATPDVPYSCMSTHSEERIGADGELRTTFEVPDPRDQLGDGDMSSTTVCANGACGPPAPSASGDPCDGTTTVCTITVDSYLDETGRDGAQPPTFRPAPIEVTFTT